MNEDGILLNRIEDKIKQSENQFMMTNSVFLDMRQRTLAEGRCRSFPGLRYEFYGGYPDAERTVALFFPDYIELPGEAGASGYFKEQEEDNPLILLRISKKGSSELNHRDYLGSLTGLGIRREMIGDILVREDGCDIVILREISSFLLYNYGKAGRVHLQAELLPISEIIINQGKREEKRDSVASLRLDNVIASAFGSSRGRAAEAISGGIVFVNGRQSFKSDLAVKEGDKLVVRGKGKAVLKTVGGSTRKDRIAIVIEKYL